MSGDSISRNAVIDEMYDLIGATERLEQQIVDVLERVSSEMPSAEKTGKWIDISAFRNMAGDYSVQGCCSVCKLYSSQITHCSTMTYEFCPHCGSKMEVEDAETNF